MALEVMKMLDYALQNPGVETDRPPDELYVSSAGAVIENPWGEPQTEGACMRKLYYQAKKYKEDSPYVQSRPASYGDVVSEFEADLAKKAGIYLGHEVGMYLNYKGCRIKGRADLMVQLPLTSGKHEKIGVEFKSIGNYFARKGTIDTPKGSKYAPKVPHTLQSAIYLDHWRKKGFTHWQVIYLDRGKGDYSNPSHKIYLTGDGEISVNGELIGVTMEQVYERFALTQKKIDLEELPDRDYEKQYDKAKLATLADRGILSKTDRTTLQRTGKLIKGDWQCAYCAFQKTCWEKS